jgi:hypothetical protein
MNLLILNTYECLLQNHHRAFYLAMLPLKTDATLNLFCTHAHFEAVCKFHLHTEEVDLSSLFSLFLSVLCSLFLDLGLVMYTWPLGVAGQRMDQFQGLLEGTLCELAGCVSLKVVHILDGSQTRVCRKTSF